MGEAYAIINFFEATEKAMTAFVIGTMCLAYVKYLVVVKTKEQNNLKMHQ